MKKFSFIKNSLLLFLAFFSYSSVFSQGAAINTTGSTADPSAGLDIQFNNKGFLLPRMSTTERNAIVNPAQGLQIINTTTNCLEIYFNPIWQSIFCGCTPPSAAITGTNSPSATEIIWSWNAAAGATGYKYNTINDFNSAIDIGTNTSYTQTGLTCNTSYTLYVWAYNICGCSPSIVLNQSTAACVFVCGSNLTFSYRGSSVTYGTISKSSICWLDRNLGAAQVATAYNDNLAYGDLFQWGRGDDGHQLRTSATTTILSSNDNPGHSNLILSPSYHDWRASHNNTLWQGITGINNPCPNGWRLPTETELNNERLSWYQNNYNGAIASILKLPASGSRNDSNGSVDSEGNYGSYWSSTTNGTNSRSLDFGPPGAGMGDYVRAYSLSVRCIKDY